MKNIHRVFSVFLMSVIVSAGSLVSTYAAGSKDLAARRDITGSYSSIVSSLSQKLKSELGESNLSVKIQNAEQSVKSNGMTEVTGQAFCVLPNDGTQLPLVFEVELNNANKITSDVQYKFVESDDAPAADEEILMKELMKQISVDYKTEQITIAIDNFNATAVGGKKEVAGAGEVKIGELVWKKIDFNVLMNADNTAEKVKYSLK